MKRRIFLIFMICITAILIAIDLCAATRAIKIKATASNGKTKEINLYSGYYALVVGCGGYRNGWPLLPRPVSDAREIAETLENLGYEVDRIEDPDWASLRKALYGIITGPGKDKERGILVWFSGHGHTFREKDGTALGYIVPVDAPDPNRDELGFMEKAISMRVVETIAKRIESKHVLMVFDSCFSGSIFNMTRARPSDFIEEKIGEPVRQFITAGNEDEEVPDRSVFKDVFIQGVKDGYGDLNKDGYVTGEELGLYLQEKVINYSRKAQHPQYGKINNPKLDKGDFVFMVAGGSAVVERPAPTVPSTPAKGSLYVTTNPSGANVFIDGRFKGVAPVTLSDLSSGRITVRAAKSGYSDQDETVFIREGQETNLTLVLDPVITKGGLKVRSEPAGARWYVDGAYVGTTPDEMKGLDAGQHRVEVKKEGYEGYSETVTVRAGETADIFARLEGVKQVSGGKSGDTWKDPVTGMEFVWVPGGCFEMGSSSGESDEKPVHEVCVSGFWMGKYEVTNAQYRRYKPGHDSKDYKGKSLNGDGQPAVYVSWNDAKGYIEWLNRENGGRYKFRLPTEAEWEYACRAGTATSRFWGDNPDDACGYANVNDLTSKRVNKLDWEHHNCDDGYAVTAPVGSFKPNGFGLYDMLGNIWESCGDIYSSDAYSKHERNNPIYDIGGSYRVIRGGSWLDRPRYVRCADRSFNRPDYRNYYLGFRLMRTP